MIFRPTLSIILCLIGFNLYAQNADFTDFDKQKKAEQFIIQGENDSALFYLQDIPENSKTKILKNIINNQASYEEILDFLLSVNVSNKQELNKLNQLISTIVEEPKNEKKINLNYVKIKWQQIYKMLNEELLDQASEHTNILKNYINQFPDKNYPDVIRANIYASSYDIIFNEIKNDFEKVKEIVLDNEQKAISVKDTTLIIMSKYYYSDYLISIRDLDGYIENCKISLDLEEKLTEKSYFHIATIRQLVDALVFKGEFEEEYIESLIFDIYSDPFNKYASFGFYAKFLGSIPENSLARKRILNQFNAQNIEDLCDTLISLAENQINSNELYHLYNESSKMLYNHKSYEKAFDFKAKCVYITRKIYSQELAQTIADNQTREVEQAKALENAKLQESIERQKIILWITSIAVIIFIILSWFLYRAIQQRNKTNAELDNANKDLKRLNVLNQKIFSVISHDFKTPMLTLSMLVNGFKRKSNDPSMSDHIAEVSIQFDNANAVLNNLLNWAKTEISISNNISKNCDVKEIANEITTQLKNLAEDKNITFQTEIPENTTVQIPADILRIVFRNLLSNAIKFSHENEVVKIYFDKNTNQLQISDSGVGMKQEKANQLFTKDVISSFGTNREPGFGMGLYIVHELLYKYNSTITVGTEIDKGSTFSVKFPVV
jgi:two-component system, sensor histidine kinase PdtaS